jgi:hypothetical protein
MIENSKSKLWFRLRIFAKFNDIAIGNLISRSSERPHSGVQRDAANAANDVTLLS